jgi:D-alanyl-lipoteichoic acid acyltransferase DltB (MBOAT superfamily)
MSLLFYAYWRPPFVLLLFGSITLNYACAHFIWNNREQQRRQKIALFVGVAANLGALAYFKYLYPLLQFTTESLGLHFVFEGVVLPLGISFFTFTQIAYLIDLAQGAAEPQDFISYVLFVTFFPHLIAGPILHHREIMPQFAIGRDFRLNWSDLALGLSWFILGLCKKVLIADRIAPYANTAFAHTAELTAAAAWIGLLNYSMQLYFDFSGYSDMAVGLSRMFSIKLPLNFDSPYKAGSIIEFWQRWHMTLTRYLTLYLYNPLSISINRRRVAAGKSNSRSARRTFSGFSALVAFPTIVTMFVVGIWHGAGFQFIIFGVLHGIYLTVNHAWRTYRPTGTLLTKVISWHPVGVMLTFSAVLVGQVFFRASSTSDALHFLASLFGFDGAGLPVGQLHWWRACAALLLLPMVWFCPNTQELLGQTQTVRRNVFGIAELLRWEPNWAWATGLGFALVAVFWYMVDTTTFLYFQF